MRTACTPALAAFLDGPLKPLAGDLLLAIRRLRRSPGFTVAAVLTLALSAVSALACLVPAIRATRVDPIDALRSE